MDKYFYLIIDSYTLVVLSPSKHVLYILLLNF